MGELVKADAQLPSEVSKEERQVIGKMFKGDFGQLSAPEQWLFYEQYCKRLALDPYTLPLKVIKTKNGSTFYADQGCAQQLANRNKLSVRPVSRDEIDGIIEILYRAEAGGRIVEDISCVSIEGLTGEARANAIMKAHTKGYRRVVLKWCGLGVADEDDAPSDGQKVDIKVEAPPAKAPAKRAAPAKKEPEPEIEVEQEPEMEPEPEPEIETGEVEVEIEEEEPEADEPPPLKKPARRAF